MAFLFFQSQGSAIQALPLPAFSNAGPLMMREENPRL